MPRYVCAAALAFVLSVSGALAQDADAPAFWGQPSVDGGQCCRTLGEVRSHIDALDKQIVALIAERTYRALIAAFEDYERAEWVKRNPAAKP